MLIQQLGERDCRWWYACLSKYDHDQFPDRKVGIREANRRHGIGKRGGIDTWLEEFRQSYQPGVIFLALQPGDDRLRGCEKIPLAEFYS